MHGDATGTQHTADLTPQTSRHRPHAAGRAFRARRYPRDVSVDSSAPPVQNPPIRRAPSPDGPPSALRFVWDSVRMGWRWLTRMRTALWMLLWLGVLTAVATVVPQAPNVPSTVERWLAGEEGPGAGVSQLLLPWVAVLVGVGLLASSVRRERDAADGAHPQVG